MFNYLKKKKKDIHVTYDENYITRKELTIRLLEINEHCIAYNKKQDIPIWNYMLSEDKINLFVYDENDKTIYDGKIEKAPDYLFNYGEMFSVVSFKGLDIPENIVTRDNFNLISNNLGVKK